MRTPAIKDLRRFMIDNKCVDNDFWDFAGNDIVRSHLVAFTGIDWIDLRSHLVNWPSDELIILADALIDLKLTSDLPDTNALYGYIFTLVEDSEADYLIQHLDILDDGKIKPVSLLYEVRGRLETLETYTSKIHKVHDYRSYYDLIDFLIKESQTYENS